MTSDVTRVFRDFPHRPVAKDSVLPTKNLHATTKDPTTKTRCSHAAKQINYIYVYILKSISSTL